MKELFENFNVSGPYNILDVDKAEKKIGLYVWFALFDVGLADWNSINAGSEESAKKNLYHALSSHSIKFSSQSLKVTATSNFSTKWTGELEEDQLNRWKKLYQNKESDENNIIDKIQKNDNTRKAFIDILKNAFPIFYSPLYIGLATKEYLKDRLTFHKNSYIRLWKNINHHTNKDNESFISLKSFSERAISYGFSPEDLFCYTITPGDNLKSTLTKKEITDIIEATEWILNRWSTPILGRR